MPDWNGAHRAMVGRHRAQGLSGPTRRYALIVLTLALTSSLPILAAFGSGPAGVDRSTYAVAGTTPFIAPPSAGPVVVVPLQPGVAAGGNVPGPPPVPIAPAPVVPVVPRPGPPLETRPALVPDPPPSDPPVDDSKPAPADPDPAPADPDPADPPVTVEVTPAAPDKPVRIRSQVSKPTVQPSWSATLADLEGDVRQRVVITLPKPNISPEPVSASWQLLGHRVRGSMDHRR